MAIYGIDLGTTYCSAACLDGASPRVVPLERGGPTLASLVLLSTGADGRADVVVGQEARLRYRELLGGADQAPAGVHFVRGSKNFIGVRDNVWGGPPWHVARLPLYATDVAALILRTIAEFVRAHPDLPPMESVVVTHPQRFRNAEKLATAQAVKLAGLSLAGLITEPDAAAWAYGFHDTGRGAGTFMVFDFGGGTLDVTLMDGGRASAGAPEIRAIGSYGVQLGGLQIDERIRDGLVERYRIESGDRSFSLDTANEATRERLLDLAERFKMDLNRDATRDPQPMARSRTKSFRPILAEGREGDEVRLKVTLGELSGWIAGEIDRALACADEALQRSGLTWRQVDDVLLTGGSSQLIALQQRVRERCQGRVQVVFEEEDHPLRPSTIVAVGAALHGAALEAKSRGTRAAVDVRGVVPDAFSVRAWKPDATVPTGRRPVLQTLVEAGTPTPFVARTRFTMRGEGTRLPVEVFEGTTEEEASPVGTFELTFDAPLQDGAPIDVELRVASNGAIVLGVIDARTGAVREAALNEAPGLFSDAELEERRAWQQDVRLVTSP